MRFQGSISIPPHDCDKNGQSLQRNDGGVLVATSKIYTTRFTVNVLLGEFPFPATGVFL
jgi:hypothetical protein